jgi:hypothetical protein
MNKTDTSNNLIFPNPDRYASDCTPSIFVCQQKNYGTIKIFLCKIEIIAVCIGVPPEGTDKLTAEGAETAEFFDLFLRPLRSPR